LTTDALVLVQVARLDHLKDHLTAVRTLERVVARRPDARLVLVGEGPERPAIEAEIGRRRLTDHVRLLGLRRDVPRLLAAADVCLLTSISEGIPLTLIEAMAARLPVVSTNVGGVSEVVRDGETGVLTPAKDDEALAAAVLQLAEVPARCREFGEAGHRRAHELFSEPQMHAAYADLYDEMLSRQPRGRAERKTSTLSVTS
jgi:glycosyltransferase involved in cell wall biosynthesis